MPVLATIRIAAEYVKDDTYIKNTISHYLQVSESSILAYKCLKKSIDARSTTIWINYTLEVYINEPLPQPNTTYHHFEVLPHNAKSIIIIGAGPAGMFAALQCIQLGIKPILLERGKDVRSRRRDLAVLNKEGIINEESNYCFGEGGAGTYSDGKLYTRSNKRGNVKRILELFVQFGATENILFEAHPHIGTNKLPQIITAMRQCIIDCGGEVLFEQKVIDFTISSNKISKVHTSTGGYFEASAVLLATGHSARDMFTLLHQKNILIEAKPFALGVRVEHPQQIINTIQYKSNATNEHLPPASYSVVEQVAGKGVFSFCMCPGGIIATASTAANELVVNGWSPSKRNNEYANSGMVVEVNDGDIKALQQYAPHLITKEIITSPLRMMYVQQAVEQQAYTLGGGKFVAPAQRLVDFTKNITSSTLPNCSYLPGVTPSNLHQVLPTFIAQTLAKGFVAFDKKLKGYYTNDALVVATESRTSSPIKIPRNELTLTHPQINNLFPCGEGAGYAGGIVSAAMDGERCAIAIAAFLLKK